MSSPEFARLPHDPVQPPGGDPFEITARNGYLPSSLPLKRLPPAFDALSAILEDMPIQKADGSPGLLADFRLGPLIDDGKLPDLTAEIDNLRVVATPTSMATTEGVKNDSVVDGYYDIDMPAVTAAFRDYSFVASAYLLEPCWETYSSSSNKNNAGANGYGLGRRVLPKCIAGPLVKCAEILDIPAFMSYAASYALYNYYLVDPSKGHDDYDNLRLVRAFEKGLDPSSSEAGFILTHIHMVACTGRLVDGATRLLSAIERSSAAEAVPSSHHTATTTTTAATDDDEEASILSECKAGLDEILTAMRAIEARMERMWAHSRPKDYMAYRTFIYGVTSQSMFPDGVVYEGQYGGAPQFFRGESGANDSIIPLLDHLCEIPMPRNPLTDILVDFRRYRPRPHRDFLAAVRERAAKAGVRHFLTTVANSLSHVGGGGGGGGGDEKGRGKVGPEAAAAASLTVLYLRVLDHVRSFRWRHWMFAREYILRHTAHPTATGGSPIITWLPNQLGAVLDLMEDVVKGSGLWAVLEEGVWNGGGSVAATSATAAGPSDPSSSSPSSSSCSRSADDDVAAATKTTAMTTAASSSSSSPSAPRLTEEDCRLVKSIMENVRDQKDRLQKEVAKYCSERDSGY